MRRFLAPIMINCRPLLRYIVSSPHVQRDYTHLFPSDLRLCHTADVGDNPGGTFLQRCPDLDPFPHLLLGMRQVAPTLKSACKIDVRIASKARAVGGQQHPAVAFFAPRHPPFRVEFKVGLLIRILNARR